MNLRRWDGELKRKLDRLKKLDRETGGSLIA
jgi:hypothetical protein